MKHYFCCAYRTILCLFLGYPLSICCWLQTQKSTSKWNGGGVIWEDFVVSSNENWEAPNNNGVSHFFAIFTHTHIFVLPKLLLQSFLNTLTVAKAVSYWSKNCFYCVTPMSMWLSLICSVFPSSFLGIVASSRWEASELVNWLSQIIWISQNLWNLRGISSLCLMGWMESNFTRFFSFVNFFNSLLTILSY